MECWSKGMRISDCGLRKQTNADCGFRIGELRDLRCAIWNVRFKTEETGCWIERMWIVELKSTMQPINE
jgi:hypothetical protein